MQGSLAYFGTDTVDEAAKIITTHIEGCTFSNRIGTDRKLSFNLNGDELDEVSLSGTSIGNWQGTPHLETSQYRMKAKALLALVGLTAGLSYTEP